MTRLLALAAILFGLTCESPVLAQALPPLSPAQQEQFKELIREYLQEHPEVIIEAINTMKRREDQAQADQQRITWRARNG